MKTLQQWLHNATRELADLGIVSARIDSELLLAAALNKDRSYLISHATDMLAEMIETEATALLHRRKSFEPIAYIVGYREFYGLTFLTDDRALIPRGESEPLVDTALEWLATTSDPQIVAEIGTGSGAIICALASNAPKHIYHATEASSSALDLAKANAANLGLAAIDFHEGNLAEPLTEVLEPNSINLLAVNLPYIPSDLLTNLDPTVRYFEPQLALDGGPDGLELYRQLFAQLPALMAPHGVIVCEHDHDQGEAMRHIADTHFPEAIATTKRDRLGDDRVLICQL